MTHSFLTLVACIKAKPGLAGRIQQDLLGLLALPLADAWSTFGLVDTKDSTVFVENENWKYKAAHDAHRQQPYVKQVLNTYEEIFAEPSKS